MIAGPRIRTLERYFARQIFGGVGFVLLGFLALFAFFDLIKEMGDHLAEIAGRKYDRVIGTSGTILSLGALALSETGTDVS